MSPSRSAWPWRILKISSCFLSPLNPWTPRSLATVLSSVMVLSFSSDRFIRLPPAPRGSDKASSVASDDFGEGRFGLGCEMAISGGLNVYGVLNSTATANLPQPLGRCQTNFRGLPLSEAHLDDGLAADLHQPLVEPDVVLLLVEDVPYLVAGLGELLTRQRFLGIELEQVVPHLGAERRRMLTGREPEDGLLDVGRQLPPLENPEAAAVLGGGRIVGEVPRQLAEVFPAHDASVHVLRPSPRRLPAVLPRPGGGQEEDMPGLEGQARFELFAIGVEVLIDVLLGHRDAEVDLAALDALHQQLLAEPLLEAFHAQALGLDHRLELGIGLGAQLLLNLVDLRFHLRVFHRDLLALGLLELESLLDDGGQHLFAEGHALLAGERLLLVLIEAVGLRLIQLVQRDGIAVDHADDAVHYRLAVRGRRGPRQDGSAELAARRRGRRSLGRLGLAHDRHPRGSSAAGQRESDCHRQDEPRRAAHARDSRRARSASRTAGQGPAGTGASNMNSFRMRTPLPARPMAARIRSGVTGVDGANVTSARPPPVSTRSAWSRRASARSPTTSSSASTGGGGGPKRSASSRRISVIASSPSRSVRRW